MGVRIGIQAVKKLQFINLRLPGRCFGMHPWLFLSNFNRSKDVGIKWARLQGTPDSTVFKGLKLTPRPFSGCRAVIRSYLEGKWVCINRTKLQEIVPYFWSARLLLDTFAPTGALVVFFGPVKIDPTSTYDVIHRWLHFVTTGLNQSMKIIYKDARTTHVPLSPSSIIWYQPMGGDALRLGR